MPRSFSCHPNIFINSKNASSQVISPVQTSLVCAKGFACSTLRDAHVLSKPPKDKEPVLAEVTIFYLLYIHMMCINNYINMYIYILYYYTYYICTRIQYLLSIHLSRIPGLSPTVENIYKEVPSILYSSFTISDAQHFTHRFFVHDESHTLVGHLVDHRIGG